MHVEFHAMFDSEFATTDFDLTINEFTIYDLRFTREE